MDSPWKFFLRQMFICSGVWSCQFTIGLCLGYPTVLISQLRAEANSTAAVSDEMASWLSSLCAWSCIPWICVLPIFTKYYGRKKLYILVCSTNFIGFLILYCSTNLMHIVISAVFNGVNFTGFLMLIVTEYSSPKYRGLFLNIKAATSYWGIWVANALGVYLHWKSIGLMGILCTIYSLIVILILPESPYWLAERGRFEECSASYKWLMGSGKETEDSIAKTVEFHRERLVDRQTVSILSISNFKNVLKSMRKREFALPVGLSALLVVFNLFSGKSIITIYAMDILTKVTGNKSSAQSAMLILDAVTVLSAYIGSFISRYLKRRTLLITSSLFSNLFLFSTSLYLYLVHTMVIAELKFVSVTLLVGFSISISVGVLILCMNISGELITLESRSLSLFVIALMVKIIMASLIKITPYVLSSCQVYGTFFIFALCSTILLVFIYKYLPETKDKSLEEIAESMNCRKIMTSAETKNLVVDKA